MLRITRCPACLSRISQRGISSQSRLISSTPNSRAAAAAPFRSSAQTTTPAKPAFIKPTAPRAAPVATRPNSTPPTPAAFNAPSPTTSPAKVPTTPAPAVHDLKGGLLDPLPSAPASETQEAIDWSRSFHGLSSIPFSAEASNILMDPISPEDVEIKPDGVVYLPEIKYRRILNRAFGPGGWGLAPRGETIVTPKSVTREYGLVVHGRLVSIARGEQQYFDAEGIPTATEGCKSNALMRCCKDLGIASELWDPVFIRKFMANHSKQVWVEHQVTKKRKIMTMRKDVNTVSYPFKEVKGASG